MNEDIEYNGTITYEVFEAAQYLFNGYRWLFLLLPPVGAAMAGFILCKSYLDWFILITLCLLSIPALDAYQKRKWRYHYKNSPYLSEPIKGKITENGVFTEVSSGTSETHWSKTIKFKSTEDLIILYISPNAFKTLSKNFFSTQEEWEKVRQLVINGMKKNT